MKNGIAGRKKKTGENPSDLNLLMDKNPFEASNLILNIEFLNFLFTLLQFICRPKTITLKKIIVESNFFPVFTLKRFLHATENFDSLDKKNTIMRLVS